MLRWLALVALLAAGCVSAADAQPPRELDNEFNNFVTSNNCANNPTQLGNCDASGIWSNGDIMWVADSHQAPQIYAYHMSNKSYDARYDFSRSTLSNAGNLAPNGIWSDGTTMWVVDTGRDKIFAYDMTNKSKRVKSMEFNLTAGSPTGIWSDGKIMWVADDTEDKEGVYAYNMKSKSSIDSLMFNSTSSGPYGIWSNGATMWVADYDSDKIYARTLPVLAQTVSSSSSPRVFVYVPPPDTTPPTVKSVERTGNATTTDRALTWDVKFSESVRVRITDVHTSYNSTVNATIPDLGMVYDTLLADVPGAVSGGSVSVDLKHPITSGLLIELVAPDCTKFTIHNQTTTFLYKLRQPHDLGDLAGVGAAGQWTLHVSDHAKYWNGTLNGWTLYLESRGVVEGSGRTHTITQYVAGPGNYTLSLDGFDIRDRAGNHLRDSEPKVNEPYHVVGAAVRTCQTE